MSITGKNLEIMKRYIDDESKRLRRGGGLVVIIGVNDLSLYFIDKLRSLPGFLGVIPDEGEEIPEEYRCWQMKYADLVYLKERKLRIYHMTKNGLARTMSRLRDVGCNSEVHRLGYGALRQQTGSKMLDAYDPLLGKTRVDENGAPEVIVFSDERKESGKDDEKAVRILTLGGSTTDPFYGNMKSWPEYLYESLHSMSICCEVIDAGVGTYDSFQEMKKLLRDGVLLSPEIVISYSGVNDGRHSMRDYPFSLKGDQMIAEHIVKNRLATHDNGLGEIYYLDKVCMGPRDGRSLFRRWYDNERLMHGMCTEFGISFVAGLQPARRQWMETKAFYQQAFAFLSEHELPDWMFDMTALFSDRQDVFIDSCHVYEEGNRIIAQYFLREVLRMIRERRERQ